MRGNYIYAHYIEFVVQTKCTGCTKYCSLNVILLTICHMTMHPHVMY